MIWLWLVLIGLGTTRVVETLKELVPWPLQAWTKSVLAIGTATALSAWLSADLKQTVLLGLGAAGLTMLVHEVRSVLYMIGDKAKTEVILRMSTPGRVRTPR